MLLDSYKGSVLIAQPKSQSNFFEEGAIIMVKNDRAGSWGVMFNKQISQRECSLADIIQHVGMENINHVDAPLYIGGPVEKGRVSVIHSSDWQGHSTREITSEISITTDISILAALANNEGPEKFRAVCGLCVWQPDQLEGEMSGEAPWTPEHRWLIAPARMDNIFDVDPHYQWNHLVIEAVDLEVKEWF